METRLMSISPTRPNPDYGCGFPNLQPDQVTFQMASAAPQDIDDLALSGVEEIEEQPTLPLMARQLMP